MQTPAGWVDVVHFWLSVSEISPPGFSCFLPRVPCCGSSSQADCRFNTPRWNWMIIMIWQLFWRRAETKPSGTFMKHPVPVFPWIARWLCEASTAPPFPRHVRAWVDRFKMANAKEEFCNQTHWSLGRIIMVINPNSIPTAFDVKSGLKL